MERTMGDIAAMQRALDDGRFDMLATAADPDVRGVQSDRLVGHLCWVCKLK